MLKIDRNTGRTKTGPLEVSSGACLTCQLFYAGTDSDLFAKGCLKSFLNAKVKSLMIKCITHGFRCDGHLSVQSASLYSAVL